VFRIRGCPGKKINTFVFTGDGNRFQHNQFCYWFCTQLTIYDATFRKAHSGGTDEEKQIAKQATIKKIVSLYADICPLKCDFGSLPT